MANLIPAPLPDEAVHQTHSFEDENWERVKRRSSDTRTLEGRGQGWNMPEKAALGW